VNTDEQRIKQQVRESYAAAVTTGKGCCAKTEEGNHFPEGRVVALAGYRPEELKVLPQGAVENSFGCGNPLAFAGVERGQTVLDIGSGAGIDCFLAADRVGPDGHVIGLDMTPAMLEKARENAKKAGTTNVEFRMGEAESMPVENESIDWIISNCVINLSPNKPVVFKEAYRVLKPGGKVSISDIMVEELPSVLRKSSALYCSCVAGAIPEEEYLRGLREAGFADVQVTARIVYDRDQLVGLLGQSDLLGDLAQRMKLPLDHLVDRYLTDKIWSAKIIATKPS